MVEHDRDTYYVDSKSSGQGFDPFQDDVPSSGGGSTGSFSVAQQRFPLDTTAEDVKGPLDIWVGEYGPFLSHNALLQE
jgi:hypothetical protein